MSIRFSPNTDGVWCLKAQCIDLTGFSTFRVIFVFVFKGQQNVSNSSDEPDETQTSKETRQKYFE